VKRTITFAALASLLLLTIFLSGCSSDLKLRSIQLQASDGTTGTVEVKGVGGTLQLQAIGTYSNGMTRDITNNVTYSVTVTPGSVDVANNPLPPSPQGLSLDVSGLATAVQPFICTFHNTNSDPTQDPVWVITGSYTVTATLNGVTSQPMFVPVASATGDGPSGECGP
jgi:hypothetical protein